MVRLLFHINKLTRKRSRRFRRFAQPSSSIVKIATLFISVGIGTYVTGVVLPNIAAIVVGRHTGSYVAFINDVPVIGTYVILIRDASRSMVEPEELLQGQIKKLKTSDMRVEQREVQGFGVSTSGSGENLLNQIKEVLKEHPHLDVIYAFSDFEVESSPASGNYKAWISDPNGYHDLEMLLTEHGVRLYLGTVKYPPPAELLEIVRKSGGNLIQ